MKIAQFAAAFLLACTLVTSARADWSGLDISLLYGYRGFGFGGCNINNQTPPYFAMHPPVYYGQRYSRPYGVSPFAAWPQLQVNPAYAPRLETERAAMIPNPYYTPGVVRSAPVNQVVVAPQQTVEPLVIKNPYYKKDSNAPGGYFTGK